MGSDAAAATYDYGKVPREIIDRVRQIEVVCARHNVDLKAAACQFVEAHPAVATLVLGAKSVPEILGNIEAMAAPVPLDFWEDLKAESLIPPTAPTPS